MSPLRVLAVAAASLALVVPAGAAAAPSHPDVTVMSRNLYLGADIITAATATDRDQLRQRAAALFGVVRQTNFPLRARAIAREIRATRPDLIGLQEVALWRRTAPGVTNDVRDARVVVYDFLALLRRALAARGLRYRASVVQREADFEVPTSLGFDVRLTMRDVILARTAKRARVQIRGTRKGTYASLLTVGLPTGPVSSVRGWTAVDATVRSRRFRFVNTHLEAYGGEIRERQAAQLLRGPLRSRSRQAILVGDLNSAPGDVGAEGLALQAVVGAGFVDAFPAAPPTDGQDERLDNPVSKLTRYIDHILSRPRLRAIRARVVGDRSRDRIGGLWPSDHAGTVATLRLRR